MPRKSAEVEKVTQWLDEDFLSGLKQYPSQIRRWFTDNVLRRSLSYLLAFTEDGKTTKLIATKDGKLKVSPAGSGYTKYKVIDGTALDTYDPSTTFEFAEPFSTIDILIEGNDAIVSFLDETNVWGDDLIMKVGYHSIDFEVYGVRIKNRAAGYTASFEFALWR